MPTCEATAEGEIGFRRPPFGSKTLIDILDWLSESAHTFGTQPRERWSSPTPMLPSSFRFRCNAEFWGPDTAALRYYDIMPSLHGSVAGVCLTRFLVLMM